MLSLQNLTVSYKNYTALNGISIDFYPNRIYGILGKSGSGKTTLTKAIATILPFQGDILINEEKIDCHKHSIALVPQNHGLIPWKTVKENIAFPLKMRKIYDEKALFTIGEELGINKLMNKYPNHISGGEQQRVSMARGFLSKPHVLLLDEAFSALDAITKEEAHQVFLRTFNHHKVTTLLITHDVEEALKLSETIVIIKDGNIHKTLKNPMFGKEKEDDFTLFLSLQKEIKAAL